MSLSLREMLSDLSNLKYHESRNESNVHDLLKTEPEKPVDSTSPLPKEPPTRIEVSYDLAARHVNVSHRLLSIQGSHIDQAGFELTQVQQTVDGILGGLDGQQELQSHETDAGSPSVNTDDLT